MACWSWTGSGFKSGRLAACTGLLAWLALFLAGCDTDSGLPVYSTVPQFNLTDQSGAAFDSAKLNNHIWVADFMFTSCPGPCPRMSSQMRQVQTALAYADVKIASFTVDPEHDTAQVLSEYASHYAARPGVWYFLTGPVTTLQHLDHDVFQLGDIDGTLQHSTRFVLIDRKSRIRGFYQTSEPDEVPRLIADAKSLLRERS